MTALYEYNKTRVYYCKEIGEHYCTKCGASLGKEFHIPYHLVTRCRNCNEILVIKTEQHMLKNYDGKLDSIIQKCEG